MKLKSLEISPITYLAVTKLFWNFAESTTVIYTAALHCKSPNHLQATMDAMDKRDFARLKFTMYSQAFLVSKQ